jgi:primase-polymerase (primpol)-like protein
MPRQLIALARWVLQRLERVGDRDTKVPYRADGRGKASATDSATWAGFKRCRDAAYARRCGVGFVVTAEDDIVGIDLDGCRDPQTGSVAPKAERIVERCATYTEVSPSKRGIRLFGRAHLPADHPCRTGAIEVYSHARYLSVTGWRLDTTPPGLTDITDALDWLFASYWPRPQPVRQRPAQGFATRTDHELIEKALQARNGERFARLWNGDWQAAGYSSQSEADLGLLSHLAYWCDGDVAQMTRLFEQSGLCRTKWLERGDYRTRTLARALAGVGHA